MPFFSIVIPAYNRARELVLCLGSLALQSFADYEVIVVDDGSTDDTADVVKSFNDPRIRYIYQQNAERSAARNNGMQATTGKYICLLDSDDIFIPEHLQVLYEQIEKDGQPVALYKTMMIYADRSRPDDLTYAYKGNDRKDAIRYVWNNGSQLICLCFHNDIARTIRFPEQFFWFEDSHWIVRVVMNYPLKQIERHTTLYNNKNSDSLKPGQAERYLENCEACIRDLEKLHGDELKQILGQKCFDIKVAELYLGLMVAGAIKEKDLKKGRAYLGKAMEVSVTPRLALKYIYYYSRLIKAKFFG